MMPALLLAACDTGSAPPTPQGTGTMTTNRGQQVFARYCNTCHPGGGRGVGPSLMMKNYSADELEAVIRHGKAQMPGFGEKVISNDDLYAVVDYVIGMKK